MKFPLRIEPDELDMIIKEWVLSGMMVLATTAPGRWSRYSEVDHPKAIIIGYSDEMAADRSSVEAGYIHRVDGWWVEVSPGLDWNHANAEAERFELPQDC